MLHCLAQGMAVFQEIMGIMFSVKKSSCVWQPSTVIMLKGVHVYIVQKSTANCQYTQYIGALLTSVAVNTL